MTKNTKNTANTETMTTTANTTIDAPRPITAEEIMDNEGLIFSVGRKFHMTQEDCEDLRQEVLLKLVVEKPTMLDPAKGTLKALLSTVAHNIAYDICHKPPETRIQYQHMDEAGLDAAAQEASCHAYVSPLDREIHKERLQLLQQGLEELRKRYPDSLVNMAFQKFYFEEMRGKDVGALLGKSEGYVNTSVNRSLKRITDIVKRLARQA